MKINDDGSVEFEGEIEGNATAILKGLLGHWINVASEDAGELFGPAFRGSYGILARKFPILNRLTNRMAATWMGKTGKSLAAFNKKIADRTGYHNILNETGEEWLEPNLKAILDIEDFGAGPDADWKDRIVKANENFVDTLPEMLTAFAIPGMIKTGAGLTSIPITKKMREQKQLDQKLKDVDAAGLIYEQYNPSIENLDEVIDALEDRPEMQSTWAEFEKELEEIQGKHEGPQALKELTLGSTFTPKWLVHRLVGADTMLEDLNRALEAMKVRRGNLGEWINKVIKKIRKEKELTQLPEMLEEEAVKEAAIPLEEMYGVEISQPEAFIPTKRLQETKAHILQKKIGEDTNPVHIMRDLLDTYPDTPPFLKGKVADIFNDIRGITRGLLKEVNAAREARGDPPITNIGSYITHWMDAAAGIEAEERISYAGRKGKKAPKNAPNYLAEKRKVKGEMEKMFSKDLGLLLHQMVKHSLRDIYITTPYQQAVQELNELNDKGLIPGTTYKEIDAYLRYDIREMQTDLDRKFNTSMRNISDLLGRFKFIKRSIDDPSRQIFGTMRKLGFLSGLGFRVKAPLRNLGQRMLLRDLYRERDYAKAQAVAFRMAKMPMVEHPQTGEQIRIHDLIREQDWYKLTLQQYEDVVSDAQTVRSKAGEAAQHLQNAAFFAYKTSHAGNLFISNVDVAGLTGYFDWKNNYEQSRPGTKHYKAARRYSIKHKVPLDSLLTHEADMLPNIREAVRRTQWEYFAHTMPTLYRGQVMRAGFQFKSWLMNYYFNHVRQMMSTMITGRDGRGRLIPGNAKLRVLKGFGTNVALGKIIGDMLGIHVLKFIFARDLTRLFVLDSPIPNLIIGLVSYFEADDEEERKKAWSKVKRGLKFYTPYSLALKDFWELFSGEQDFDDVLFYQKENK